MHYLHWGTVNGPLSQPVEGATFTAVLASGKEGIGSNGGCAALNT